MLFAKQAAPICIKKIMINDILSDCFNELIEVLAKNVHARWLQKREKAGWTYGITRNDTLKQTPCLVPYDKLSEDEKQYDRETVITVLTTLDELGYKIIK